MNVYNMNVIGNKFIVYIFYYYCCYLFENNYLLSCRCILY